MDKKFQWNAWYFLLAFSLLLMFQGWWSERQAVEPIAYSEFLKLLKDGKLTEISIDAQQIRGKLQEPIKGRTHFVTNRVEPALADELAASGATFSAVRENTVLGNLLSWLLPLVVIFAFWRFLFRRLTDKQGLGGLVSVGGLNVSALNGSGGVLNNTAAGTVLNNVANGNRTNVLGVQGVTGVVRGLLGGGHGCGCN